jgi:hypothetical protein
MVDMEAIQEKVPRRMEGLRRWIDSRAPFSCFSPDIFARKPL